MASSQKIRIRVGGPVAAIGIDQNKAGSPRIMTDMPRISVITCTNRPHYEYEIFANYVRQEYPNKELIIILNDQDMSLEEWTERANNYPAVKVFQLNREVSLGECFNFGVSKSKGEYIAKFDDDDYYAPRYLVNSIKALRRTKADIVGKSARFVFFEVNSVLAICDGGGENRPAEYVAGATLLINRRIFDWVKFPEIDQGDDSVFQSDCLKQGFKIYSADMYNYVTIRRSDPASHTFQMPHEVYLGYCKVVGTTRDYITPTTR